MKIKLILTEDGSHSLYDVVLNETYHSTKGAASESQYVYIDQGLRYYQKNCQEPLNILEIGLGTGLNVLLTEKYAMTQAQKIMLTSLEPFPIAASVYSKLNYASNDHEKQTLNAIHQKAWNIEHHFSSYFTFTKNPVSLENFHSSHQSFDVIYFDAFAPGKQPDIWKAQNLKKCYDLLKKKGILTTYCAQGAFKRNLKKKGFIIESLPGALGKKEMIRAFKS